MGLCSHPSENPDELSPLFMGHTLQGLGPPLLPHTFFKASPVTAATGQGVGSRRPHIPHPCLHPSFAHTVAKICSEFTVTGAHELCTEPDQFISSCQGGIKGPVWVTAFSAEPRTLCGSHLSLQCSTLRPSQMPVSLPYAGLMVWEGARTKSLARVSECVQECSDCTTDASAVFVRESHLGYGSLGHCVKASFGQAMPGGTCLLSQYVGGRRNRIRSSGSVSTTQRLQG